MGGTDDGAVAAVRTFSFEVKNDVLSPKRGEERVDERCFEPWVGSAHIEVVAESVAALYRLDDETYALGSCGEFFLLHVDWVEPEAFHNDIVIGHLNGIASRETEAFLAELAVDHFVGIAAHVAAYKNSNYFIIYIWDEPVHLSDKTRSDYGGSPAVYGHD